MLPVFVVVLYKQHLKLCLEQMGAYYQSAYILCLWFLFQKKFGVPCKKMLPSCRFLSLMKIMAFLTQTQNTQNTYYSQTHCLFIYIL